MRVSIRLFARLREIVGASEIERDVPDGATLGRVWDVLAAEFPALAPYKPSVSGAVNLDYAKMQTVVRDGDEVAFLPPVSGG
jgi:molybdopterin converting factor subunit 1